MTSPAVPTADAALAAPKEFGIIPKLAAEAFGTFILVFGGLGVALFSDPSSAPLPAPLAIGLSVAVGIAAVGHISGGHFNPAVTHGFLVTRRIEPMLAVVYWIVQFAGAAVAAALLDWFFPSTAVDATHLGAPALTSVIGSGAGLVMEAIMTFLLVWVIFATAADPRGTFKSIAGLAIGLTITVDILVGGPLTGAAMNPARAFGPEIVDNFWTNAWVWYVGPAIGGVAAALAYEYLYLRPLAPVPVGPPETGVEEPRPGETAAS
jgi:aquaporin Z